MTQGHRSSYWSYLLYVFMQAEEIPGQLAYDGWGSSSVCQKPQMGACVTTVPCEAGPVK